MYLLFQIPFEKIYEKLAKFSCLYIHNLSNSLKNALKRENIQLSLKLNLIIENKIPYG